MLCKSKVCVGKQDRKYYCEIITCIVITLINITSSRNINCDYNVCIAMDINTGTTRYKHYILAVNN
jgi:hypothetical protein